MTAELTIAAATPAWQRVIHHGWYETKTVARNGEQLLLTLVLPIGILILLSRFDGIDIATDAGQTRLDVIVPGILALAILSTAFTSQAIATAFDRRSGALRMFSTTPLGSSGVIGGKIVAVLLVEVGQFAILSVAAVLLGWRPPLLGFIIAVVPFIVGTAACVALALLIAVVLRPEAVLAVANLVWIVLVAVGGIVIPASYLPDGVATIAQWLPSGALGDAMRSAFLTQSLDWAAVGILAGWAVVAGLVAARRWRWS